MTGEDGAMSGRHATAKALLEAGNLQRAQAEAERLLLSSPHDVDALAIYCDVLGKLKRLDLLEVAASDWLGRDPASVVAFGHLMFCMMKASRREEAGRLLQAFLQGCTDPQDQVLAQAMYDVAFADAGGGWGTLSQEVSSEGRDAAAHGYASRAARAQGDLPGALAEAMLAMEAGDTSATHLEYISVLHFRLMQFPTCRRFAQMALNADPTLAVSRELLYLSWAVFFPPFLVAHVLNFLRFVLARQRWIVIAAIFVPLCLFAGPVVTGIYWIIAAPGSWIGIPDFFSLALSVAYFAYTLRMRGSFVKLFMPSSHAPVRLRDY